MKPRVEELLAKASAMQGDETQFRDKALRPSSDSDWSEKIHARPAEFAFQVYYVKATEYKSTVYTSVDSLCLRVLSTEALTSCIRRSLNRTFIIR